MNVCILSSRTATSNVSVDVCVSVCVCVVSVGQDRNTRYSHVSGVFISFRMLVCRKQVLQAADTCGFIGSVIEGCIWDIFGNQTDELTMMWQECLLQFCYKTADNHTADIDMPT